MSQTCSVRCYDDTQTKYQVSNQPCISNEQRTLVAVAVNTSCYNNGNLLFTITDGAEVVGITYNSVCVVLPSNLVAVCPSVDLPATAGRVERRVSANVCCDSWEAVKAQCVSVCSIRHGQAHQWWTQHTSTHRTAKLSKLDQLSSPTPHQGWSPLPLTQLDHLVLMDGICLQIVTKGEKFCVTQKHDQVRGWRCQNGTLSLLTGLTKCPVNINVGIETFLRE